MVKRIQCRLDSGLCVEHVEDGLDEHDVAPTLDEGEDLFAVGGIDVIPGRIPRRGVIHVG